MNTNTDRRTAHVSSRRFGVCAAVLMSLVLGCSRGPELANVEGVVTLDGQPLEKVEVIFLPDSEKGNTGPRASSYTDAQGHYKLHCDQANQDGAALGLNRIYIRDLTVPIRLPGMKKAPAELARPDAQSESGKGPRVPAVYTSAGQTPLHLEVKPGSQTHNIELQSAQRR